MMFPEVFRNLEQPETPIKVRLSDDDTELWTRYSLEDARRFRDALDREIEYAEEVLDDER